MRHNKGFRKLSRSTPERKALLRSLAIAILRRQRIITTLPKAKEARSFIDKIITLGKRGDIPSQRMAFAILRDRSLVKELVNEIAPRFKNRQGGYTRIIKLAKRRKGDNAEVALLELTEQKVIAPPLKKVKKEKKPEPKETKAEHPSKEAPRKEEAPPQKPPKEEPPKHIEKKEEKRPHVEKPKKGFFHGLQKFLRPPKTTS